MSFAAKFEWVAKQYERIIGPNAKEDILPVLITVFPCTRLILSATIACGPNLKEASVIQACSVAMRMITIVLTDN